MYIHQKFFLLIISIWCEQCDFLWWLFFLFYYFVSLCANNSYGQILYLIFLVVCCLSFCPPNPTVLNFTSVPQGPLFKCGSTVYFILNKNWLKSDDQKIIFTIYSFSQFLGTQKHSLEIWNCSSQIHKAWGHWSSLPICQISKKTNTTAFRSLQYHFIRNPQINFNIPLIPLSLSLNLSRFLSYSVKTNQ